MKILRYIKIIIICVPVILFYHFRYTLRFLKHPDRYSLEYKYKTLRKEVVFVMKRFKVNFESMDFNKIVEGEKKLIICNHLSDMDPLFLIAMSENPITFVSKKETFKFPFIGKCEKVLEVFSLDRENLMNQARTIADVVSYLKNEEKPPVVIFIEGTRNKHPENPCLDFHPGTIKIAQKAGVPIAVSSIYGTFRILNKKSYLKTFPVYASYIKTISAEEVQKLNSTEAAPVLQKLVDESVDNLRRKDLEYILTSKNTKRRKRLETAVDIRVNS